MQCVFLFSNGANRAGYIDKCRITKRISGDDTNVNDIH